MMTYLVCTNHQLNRTFMLIFFFSLLSSGFFSKQLRIFFCSSSHRMSSLLLLHFVLLFLIFFSSSNLFLLFLQSLQDHIAIVICYPLLWSIIHSCDPGRVVCIIVCIVVLLSSRVIILWPIISVVVLYLLIWIVLLFSLTPMGCVAVVTTIVMQKSLYLLAPEDILLPLK